tara:strand:+ start:67 stop:378 length:312 start_codon:yes stop_codon:yes gene_type:complete
MFVGVILKGTSKDSETVPANTYGDYLKIEERILDYTDTSPSGKTVYHYKLACLTFEEPTMSSVQSGDCMMVDETELENAIMYGYYKFTQFNERFQKKLRELTL